jgi:hypothetical protein
MDPLEWLARMSDHIPDAEQHGTLFYGEYTNRVRGVRQPLEPDGALAAAYPPPKRCSSSRTRLIAKVYQANPLVCTQRVEEAAGELSRILDGLRGGAPITFS